MAFLRNDFKQISPQPEPEALSSSLVRQGVEVETSNTNLPPSQPTMTLSDVDLHQLIASVEAFLNDLREHLNTTVSQVAPTLDVELEKERALRQKAQLELANSQEKVMDMARKLQRLQSVVAECVGGSVMP